MKTKSSKTSKNVATKKGSTGSTKGKAFPMYSLADTPPTSWYMDLKVSDISNLKGISTDLHGGRWTQYADLTKDATFEFSLRRTPFSPEERALVIRIGPNGTAIRMPSDAKFQKIGWPKPKKVKKRKSDINDLLDEFRNDGEY